MRTNPKQNTYTFVIIISTIFSFELDIWFCHRQLWHFLFLFSEHWINLSCFLFQSKRRECDLYYGLYQMHEHKWALPIFFHLYSVRVRQIEGRKKIIWSNKKKVSMSLLHNRFNAVEWHKKKRQSIPVRAHKGEQARIQSYTVLIN